MRVKANHATIREIVAHADKIVRAFRRLQNDLTTVIAPAPEEVRQKAAALLFDMNMIPVESIFALRAIAEFYEEEFERIEKQAGAVRKCRARQELGMPSPRKPYTERKGPRARTTERPPELYSLKESELYSSEEYEEIARKLRAEESKPKVEELPAPLPQPQPLTNESLEVEISARPAKHSVAVDATPKTGKVSLDF